MPYIKVDARKVLEKLGKAEKGIKNLTPFFRSAETFLKSATKEQFETEGKYMTARWNKLKPSTKKSRAIKGYAGKPILENTGRLKNSYKTKFRGSTIIVWGTNVPYAEFHQLGTTKMRARRVLAMNKRMREAIDKLFTFYINQLLK